jgi:hypothetical protein
MGGRIKRRVAIFINPSRPPNINWAERNNKWPLQRTNKFLREDMLFHNALSLSPVPCFRFLISLSFFLSFHSFSHSFLPSGAIAAKGGRAVLAERYLSPFLPHILFRFAIYWGQRMPAQNKRGTAQQ